MAQSVSTNNCGFSIAASGAGTNRLDGAVNDAVAMAYRFVVELGVVVPAHSVVTIQGELPDDLGKARPARSVIF
jgi:hypothetical protein